MFRTGLVLGSMFATLCFVAGCGHSGGFEPTENAVLEKSDSGELLALNPSPNENASNVTTTGKDFHGYSVLGRSELQKDERDRLIQATRKAIDANEGRPMNCFKPRHALRIVARGDTLDLVISFECLQMKVYQGAEERMLLIGQEQQGEFDEALSRHSLQKAP